MFIVDAWQPIFNNICLQTSALSLSSFSLAVLASKKVLAALPTLALSLASLSSLASKEIKNPTTFASLTPLSALSTWVDKRGMIVLKDKNLH